MMINKYSARKYIDIAEDSRLREAELRKKYQKMWFIENSHTDTQGFAFIESHVELCSDLQSTVCSNLCSNLKNVFTLVIAFRGSQQPKDWLTDFNAWHQTMPYDNVDSNIKVHTGFINAYKSVRDQVHAIIEDVESKVNRVIICGHSLGGALAQLCAVDIQFNFDKKIECYASGSPAVGNKEFATSYNIRVPNTVRTYMRKDIVPMMPPANFQKSVGGYKQVETKWAIGPTNFFWGLLQWFKPKKEESFAANLTNHAIFMYKTWMEK